MNGMDEQQRKINERMAGPPDPESPAAMRNEIEHLAADISVKAGKIQRLQEALESLTENAIATEIINEVLDYFQKNNTDPGGWWVFPDDYSSLNLEFRSKSNDTAFWLDIERDGTLRLVWRPNGGDLKSLTFVHRDHETNK